MKAIVAILGLVGFSYMVEARELKNVRDIKDMVCLSETANETKVLLIKSTTSIDGRFLLEEYSQNKAEPSPDLSIQVQQYMFLRKTDRGLDMELLADGTTNSFVEVYTNERNELKATGLGLTCSISLKSL